MSKLSVWPLWLHVQIILHVVPLKDSFLIPFILITPKSIDSSLTGGESEYARVCVFDCVSAVQLHAEACYAECQLQRAALTFLQVQYNSQHVSL